MDIVAVLLILLLLSWIVGGASPWYGRYTPTFDGSNIVWTVIVLLLVVWLLRHLF